MYKITDRWTTRDGSWEPSNKEYSITKEMADKYGNNFPQKGGATHLFARIEGGPSQKIRFSTRDSNINVSRYLEQSGWANIPIEHGSAYNPDRGESGWWNMRVEDAAGEIAEGFGLPYSWHVSNFVVFKWQEGDVEEPDEPVDDGPEVPPTDPDKHVIATIYLYSDGTYEKHENQDG